MARSKGQQLGYAWTKMGDEKISVNFNNITYMLEYPNETTIHFTVESM